MHGKFSHHISIIRWMALALLGLCLAQLPARAQTPAGQDSIWIDIGSPVGVASGQALRITVLNPLAPAPPGEDGRKYKMLFAPLILDADGQVIARRDEITLDPGQFHSFDFKRADLPLAGEPDTGRLQVRSEIRRRFFSGITNRISQGELDNFFGTVELVDSGTGKTLAATLLGKEVGNDELNGQYVITGVNHWAVGLIPGQTLRVSVANPNVAAPAVGQGESIRAQVQLYDARGNLIAQSAEMTIPAGQFHSFDFNRNAIPLAGELGTGRVQTRAQVRYRPFQLLDRTRAIGHPASIELIDNSTGRTTAVWVTVGFFEVVQPQKPQ